jgi:hypothetical protein
MSDTIDAIGTSTDDTVARSGEIRDDLFEAGHGILRVLARAYDRDEGIIFGKCATDIEDGRTVGEFSEERWEIFVTPVNHTDMPFVESTFDIFDKFLGIFVEYLGRCVDRVSRAHQNRRREGAVIGFYVCWCYISESSLTDSETVKYGKKMMSKVGHRRKYFSKKYMCIIDAPFSKTTLD